MPRYPVWEVYVSGASESQVDLINPPPRGERITPEMSAWLQARSAAFQRATQRKGMPMTYGSGKKPEKS